jgi:hypothetical protein
LVLGDLGVPPAPQKKAALGGELIVHRAVSIVIDMATSKVSLFSHTHQSQRSATYGKITGISMDFL